MANQCRQCGCKDDKAETCPVCNIPMEIYAQDDNVQPTDGGMGTQDDGATEPAAVPEPDAAPVADPTPEAPAAPEAPVAPAEGEEETPAA